MDYVVYKRNTEKIIWSNTCNNFPRKNIDFAENKLQTLSMSCPEAARLCLSDKNSMEIIEDKFYTKKRFNLVSEKFEIF